VTKDEAEAIFLRHLAAIERLTANACRQSRIAGDEIDDLTSHVKLALIQGDYAIIRKFQGRSSFTTFLTTVIRRLISQYQIKERGRWRPSAKAKRLGQLAMTVERLLTREGWSISEVAREVARRHPGCATGDILEIAHQLPQRHGRPQQVSISDHLHTVIDADDPLQTILNRELSLRATRAVNLLQTAIATLSVLDQTILRKRFLAEQKVRVIADSLQVSPRKAYKRLYASLSLLRLRLEEQGFMRREILDLTGHESPALDDLSRPRFFG
jgi:RNA polymerase sigma factor (sigma-70 family)